MRRRAVALVVGLVMALGSALSVSAAPAPSATFVLVCSSSVTYTNVDDAPAAQVTLFAGGQQVGASQYVVCPSGGGRIRTKVPTSVNAVTAKVSCWNGFIQSGDTTGPLALKGSCVDSAGSYGTFASFAVR